MKSFPRAGHIVTIPAIVLIGGLSTWLAVRSALNRLGTTTGNTQAVSAMPLMSLRSAGLGNGQFEAPSLEIALRRVSLDPEALTAAGVTTKQDVEAVVGAVQGYLALHGTAIGVAQSALDAAKVNCEALERLVASGQASQGEISQCATAKSTLNTCTSTLSGLFGSAFDAGVDGLDQAVITRLENIRANRATDFSAVPVQHLVESRTDVDLLALRDALAEERICAKWDETPSSAGTTLLSNERARTEVSQAKSRLDSSLSTVESLWASAIAG